MRKLASIRRISDIKPITNADKVCLYIVDGWQVVDGIGKYSINELVCFVEIDSWVPNQIAPFLTSEGKEPKEYNGVKGERLRTVRLRGEYSQGLLLPVTKDTTGTYVWFMDYNYGETNMSVELGDDVTKFLGIQKWEAPEQGKNSGTRIANGEVSRPFPYFIRKTDQTRVQNIKHMVESHLNDEFEVTIKKDGSSMTVFRVDTSSKYYKAAKQMMQKKRKGFDKIIGMLKDLFSKASPVYGVCSRNMMLDAKGTSNFHKAADKYDLFKKLNDVAEKTQYKSVALQGELVAPNIQDNHEKVKDIEWHCFDIFDIDEQDYMLPNTRRLICNVYDINHVTVLESKPLRDIIPLDKFDCPVQACLEYAEGDGDNAGVKREGVCFKHCEKDFSFKAISNSYLLKKG